MKFDVALAMEDEVHDLVTEVSWKLRTLQRSRRFHTDSELVNLYKSRVLGYLEYRTPAVYHATSSALQPLDKLQERFLREAGVSTFEALMVFNLAPLAARRDVAMLGLIHRCVLEKGPQQFREFFKPADKRQQPNTRLQKKREKHGRQLHDPRKSSHLNVVRRSALGLVAVYNLLPAAVVRNTEVKDFQRELQELFKKRAEEGEEDWAETFSPRVPL